MTFGEFLADRLGNMVAWAAALAVTAAFLLATGTAPGVLAILAIAWCAGFGCVQAFIYHRRRAHLEELEAIMEGLDQKHLFFECVPKPQGLYERRLLALMRRSGQAMVEQVSDARAAQQEYREYIESWVHEIKTPITAAQLVCRSADGKTRRKLAQELAQIENQVERALFYARAGSPEKDFIIRQTDLAELVAGVIARHQTLLIQSGVRIRTQDLGHTVYTDEKWVCFMLGQLLQNAVRYRGETPELVLSGRQLGRQVQLTVQDNGIGIPAEELPRVFERGFTGSNGRRRGGSTGMGLYLCRRLASFLQIEVQVRSEAGQGTGVTLTFPAREDLTKV